MSLTAAYGAFADEGIVPTALLIRRVEDSDGKVLYQERATSHRAVSEATAFLMSSMLADVINAGTAYRARQAGSRCRRPARPARPTTMSTRGSSASRRSW